MIGDLGLKHIRMRAFPFRHNQYFFLFSPVLFRRYKTAVKKVINVNFFILILLLSAQGYSQKEVASIVRVTPQTVGKYVKRYKKQ